MKELNANEKNIHEVIDSINVLELIGKMLRDKEFRQLELKYIEEREKTRAIVRNNYYDYVAEEDISSLTDEELCDYSEEFEIIYNEYHNYNKSISSFVEDFEIEDVYKFLSENVEMKSQVFSEFLDSTIGVVDGDTVNTMFDNYIVYNELYYRRLLNFYPNCFGLHEMLSESESTFGQENEGLYYKLFNYIYNFILAQGIDEKEFLQDMGERAKTLKTKDMKQVEDSYNKAFKILSK